MLNSLRQKKTSKKAKVFFTFTLFGYSVYLIDFCSLMMRNFFFVPELVIPANANVYYAVSTQYDLNFILREKKDDLDVSLQDASSGGGDGSMLTPKSGLRKGSRDASKARRKLLGLHL